MRRIDFCFSVFLEATVGIRRTTPFYAMLFGRPAVHYARCVQRDSYARIDYR